MKNRTIPKVILIIYLITIFVSALFVSTFAETEEVVELGDVIAENLVKAQANQNIYYVGEDAGYRFDDLVVIKNGITYLPIRLGFSGSNEKVANVEGISTAVEPFMWEPSVKISVQYEMNGEKIRKQVDLRWFTDETLQKLNEEDDVDRKYFGFGITPSTPCGKMWFWDYHAITDSEGNNIDFYPTSASGPNGLPFKEFEAMPEVRGTYIPESAEKSTARVYIPINDFNDMMQFLVGDTGYHVEIGNN